VMHWVVDAEAFEERTQNHQPVHVSTGRGRLWFSSQRLLFFGTKNYAFPLSKLVKYEFHPNGGLSFYTGGRSKETLFNFDRLELRLIKGILEQSIRLALQPSSKPFTRSIAKPIKNDIARVK
jgi:hypothetical protein